jgi:hypothetical protein
MTMRTAVMSVVLIGLLSAARSGSAQDAVAAIKDLYESAAYEDALSAIDKVSADTPLTGPRSTELRKYRALCLLALTRTADAERVIDAMLLDNPQYRPDPQESPRWISAVNRGRSRVAPVLIRNRYAEGKRHFDKQEFAPATTDFELVLQLLDDPALDRSTVESLADVGTLSRGFLDLSRAAAPPPARTPATTSSVKPPPARGASTTAVTGSGSPSFYTATDQGVTLPVVVRQDLPPWRTDIRGRFEGELDVLISETGNVESAQLRKAVHPLYDSVLLAAAQAWKYQPAMKNGVPVKFRKTLSINLGVN